MSGIFEEAIAACGVRVAALLRLSRLEPGSGRTDQPSARRSLHGDAVALVGGLALFGGAASTLLTGGAPLAGWVVCGSLGAALLLAVGESAARPTLVQQWRFGVHAGAGARPVLGGGVQLPPVALIVMARRMVRGHSPSPANRERLHGPLSRCYRSGRGASAALTCAELAPFAWQPFLRGSLPRACTRALQRRRREAEPAFT